MTAPLIQGESGSGGDTISYANINENNLDIYTFTADESVSWSITGGEKSLFIIDENTGKLSFKSTPDYENTATLNGTTIKFTTNYSSPSVGNTFFVELLIRFHRRKIGRCLDRCRRIKNLVGYIFGHTNS